jgi:hypothetical protein
MTIRELMALFHPRRRFAAALALLLHLGALRSARGNGCQEKLEQACELNQFCSPGAFLTVDVAEILFLAESQQIHLLSAKTDGFHQHTHAVYQGERFYAKLWEEQDPRCDLVLDAFLRGFFDNIAALVALIFSNTRCRGYVTKACAAVEKCVDYIPRGILSQINWDATHPPHFEMLLEAIRENQTKTGYIYADITIANLGKLNGRIYLIDLDSMLPPDFDKSKINRNGFVRMIR